MELKTYLLALGFRNTISDSSLFVLCDHQVTIYLLVYVDDIVITSNNPTTLQNCISNLAAHFSLKDLGPLTYFLGIEVLHTSKVLFLNR